MRFRVDQPLAVSRDLAEQALVDPGFYASMGAMSKIGTPEVLWREEDGASVRVAVRYRFTGHLAPAARAVLDPSKMSWVIESTVHRGEHVAEFRMLPDHYGDRLQCAGTYSFEERGAGAVQVVEGDVTVRMPLVGRAVERAILMGLREHLAEEAELVARWAAPGVT